MCYTRNITQSFSAVRNEKKAIKPCWIEIVSIVITHIVVSVTVFSRKKVPSIVQISLTTTRQQ